MSEKPKIAPKSEWPALSISQLYDLKFQMSDLYWNMKGAGATFANQYQKLISEVDAWIRRREAEKIAEEREAQQ